MDKFTNSYYLFFFIIILFNLTFLKFNKKIGKKLKLEDIPDNYKKKHKYIVFQLGGTLIYLNFILLIICTYLLNINIVELDKNSLFSLIFGSTSIYILGLIDDRKSISPLTKMTLLSIILYLVLKIDNSLIIENLYFETFSKNISISRINIFFSILCFLLFLNAINMFDGINLQLGTYSIIFFIYLVIIDVFLSTLLIFISFYILIFLYFNYRNKFFLGDSGSLLLAYLLGYVVVKSYNYGEIKNVEEIFILMAIPGIDMLRLFVFRILNNQSPFKGDRTHIHHYIFEKKSVIETNFIIQSLIFMSFLMIFYINNFINILIVILIYSFLIIKFRKN